MRPGHTRIRPDEQSGGWLRCLVWNDPWWQEGQIAGPTNFPVRTHRIEYPGGDVTVPAMVARPDDDEHYSAVRSQDGRGGLDELVQRQVRRIAARGFVVLAPDV